MTAPDVVVVPHSNHAYSAVSLDFNPIHTHGPVADLVDLPTTITHGMWTCANARRVLETWVNRNEPKRLEEFEVRPTLSAPSRSVLASHS